MAGGAVPIANPGDPMGWGAYKANVDDMAKLDPEQKAVLDDMRKRTERRMSRAEKQEKGITSDVLIAGGLAMMGGFNLPDGVRRFAEQGGKKYFESSADARKAIEAADDAQSAFDQYQLSLKQGNKKVAAEMYGKYFNTMTDFQGKIQAASISAGASMANAQATREATAANREMQERRYDLDRDSMMQRHQETILAQKDNFKTRMAELGENRRVLELKSLEDRELKLIAEARATETAIYNRFAPRLQQFEYKAAGKPLSPQDQKAYDALVKEFNAEAKKAVAPVRKKLDETLIRQGEVMGISAPSSAGSNSGFRVVGVR
jgi:Ni/Co efflux regulator RcnB